MARINYEAPDNAKPWERMTGESSPAYGAFLTYRDLPHNERSLSRLASDLGKSGTTVATWSSDWGWQNRIAAWEAELQRAQAKGALEEAERMGKRQAAHLSALSRVLIAPAEILLERMRRGELRLDSLTDAELYGLTILAARVAPTIVRAERLVRGQPTDIVAAPDDEGLAHIPEDARWLAEFYGAAETMGLELTNRGLAPAELPAGGDSDVLQGDSESA